MRPLTFDFEKNLVREQALADNMTTFRPYPFPGRLLEVPYPLTELGRPLAPSQLQEYCRFRQFDLPTCFHGKESALVTKESLEDSDSYVILECDVRGPDEERCPFLINLTALLQNDDGYMEFCLYHRRSYSPSQQPLREMSIFTDEENNTDTSSASSDSSSDANMSSPEIPSKTSENQSTHSADEDSDEGHVGIVAFALD
ncbi:hypothetical protein CVT26_006825 [Gymnopilus dilepis]|uniref:Uncharacterized protein n=1 Tax=Gymnopilus dilepis TaxID=231916 RepID=A0A409VMW3_9AGAR|nr:hypothetical protein CVT26_006825 [Gymnopilus dilepis]